MKIRNLFLSVLATAAVLVGCEEKGGDFGAPSIKIKPAELTFEQVGQTNTVSVTSSRDWKVVETTIPEGWNVTPMSGQASSSAVQVSVVAPENNGTDISAKIKFTAGVVEGVLTVNQAGTAGDPEDMIVYFNDFDKELATKTYGESGTYWPYLDQFEGWKNEKGSGADGVTYEFKGASARANSLPKDGSGLSAKNNVMVSKNSGSYFRVKEITLPEGVNDYVLSFGVQKYDGANISNEYVKAYISKDGSKWVELKWTVSDLPNENYWKLASHTFTLPEGTSKLYIHLANEDSTNDFRVEDLKLLKSIEAGESVDFSNGVDLGGGSGSGEVVGTPQGTGTLEDPFNAAAAHEKIKTLEADVNSEEVYVKGKIAKISEVNLQYGNAGYSISDDGNLTGALDIFRGYYFNGDKFTSEGQINEGDEVVVCGKLVNYKGNTPQMAQGSKIISINGKDESEIKTFHVSPSDIDVAADETSYTIKVSGNVSWTATVTEAEDGFVTISEGNSGTGEGNIVLAITPNSLTDRSRTAKIKVSTTESGVHQKEFEVVLTQARKIAGGVGSEVYTLDAMAVKGSNNAYANSEDIEVNGITWNVTGNLTMQPWRIGGKDLANVDREVYTKTSYAKELTKIVLTLGTKTLDLHSCKLVYSTNADFAGAEEIPFDYKQGEIELMAPNGNFPANAYYKFVFNVSAGSKNQYVQFSKVVFWAN